MSDQFVAEIRIFGCNFAPKGWAFCNGQILPLSQNTALFALVGTIYGGNGQTNFALPNLQGQFPMHTGQGPGLSFHVQGEAAGSTTVTLLTSEMPSHSHTLNASPGAVPTAPGSLVAIGSSPAMPYRSGATTTTMSPSMIGVAGATQPHNNMPPYLALNFCIALQGIFPPRF